MPLFKSLRSKSSSRKSIASSVITTNGNEKDSDFAPQLTSSATRDSVRSSKVGLPSSEYSSPIKQTSPPAPPLPRQTSVTSVGLGKGSSKSKDLSMMRSNSEFSSGLSKGTGSHDGGPRPSELFAGKGVQWDAVKLVGPNITTTPIAGANKTEDLQNFLKQRRQWKPTFATEDDNDKFEKDFQPPKDLSHLSFASGDKVESQGLMSLKELEESHKRKERLLSAAPLGGSLWDEAETSKAAAARSAQGTLTAVPASFTSRDATRYGSKPKNHRQASSQSVSSNKSIKRFFGGSKTLGQSQITSSRDSSTTFQQTSNEKSDGGVTNLLPETLKDDDTAIQTTDAAPAISKAALQKGPEAVQVEQDTPADHHSTEAGMAALDPVPENKSSATADEHATDARMTQKTPPETEDAVVVGKEEDVAASSLIEPTSIVPSEAVAGDDADKTLTTNDVEKMPLVEEKKLPVEENGKETVGETVLKIPEEVPMEDAAPVESSVKSTAAATIEVDANAVGTMSQPQEPAKA